MKYLIVLVLGASITSVVGQGLINFYNTPSTLVSDFNGMGSEQPINNAVQTYFFVLLTSPVRADTFSFAGVYATNTPTPGMINGGSGVAVPGWAAGMARDFVVFGWRTIDGGVAYNPAWLTPNLSFGSNDPESGLSTIGTGVAGGVTGGGTVPTLNIFGGPTGIQSGFAFRPIPVPEPSSTALLALGAAALLMRYCRNKSKEAEILRRLFP